MKQADHFENSAGIKRLRMAKQTSSVPESHSSAKPKWQRFLTKYIEPDFGLLDRLLSYELLSDGEFLAIKALTPVEEKNEAIISYIERKNRYPELLDVLRETNQGHLVKNLTPDGLQFLDVYPFSVERLVTYKEEMTIRINRDILLELIEGTAELSDKLHSIGVLSRRQKEYIIGQPGDMKGNEVLLEILTRGTIGNYEETICCLRKSGQQHVADILEGGATARVRCWLVDTRKELVLRKDLEETMIRFTERLRQEDDAALELKSLGLRTVKLDKELIFYFHFKTMEQMKDVFDSRAMEVSVDKDFRSLQLPTDQLRIFVEWPKNDFKRCVKYFHHISSTTIDALHGIFGLLDMIVLKAYKRVFGQSSEDRVMGLLSSTCLYWYNMISRNRLKFSRRLNRAIRKGSSIIRNNQHYLTENMQPDELIGHLTSVNCLSNAQAKSISRRPFITTKNKHLLDVIRSLPVEKQIPFLEYLHFTEQRHVADVVEKGGVMIKVVALVKADVAISIDSLENILAKRRENYSRQDLRKIGLNGVELREMGLDRSKSIVLWLWCRTKHSIFNLRMMHEGNHLHKSISTLLRSQINSECTEVHVESKQLQKNCIVRRLSAKLRGSLTCPIGKNSIGMFAVSSLQDKIYATSDRTIQIYEGKFPYKQLEYTISLLPSVKSDPLVGPYLSPAKFTNASTSSIGQQSASGK